MLKKTLLLCCVITTISIPFFLNANSQQRSLENGNDWTAVVKRKANFIVAHFIKKALYFPRFNGVTKQNNPVVLIVVDQNNQKSKRFFKKETSFAYTLSKKLREPLLLLFFEWSGKNEEERKKSTSASLAHLINLFSETEDASKVFVLAYENGGTIARSASELIKRDIDILITIATPPEKKQHLQHHKVKTSYNFYSVNDTVQIARSSDNESFSPQRKQPYRPGENTVNISIKIEGEAPEYVTLKEKLLPGLLDVLADAEMHYHVHDDLIADISYGYNNKNPRVSLAINNPLTTLDITERGNEINFSDPIISDALKEELLYSKQQENAFKQSYPKKKNIHENTPPINIVYQSLVNTAHYFSTKIYQSIESIFG